MGMKCDSEAVYRMQYTINYNDLFTGLCDPPKSLEERNRFIDELFDRITIRGGEGNIDQYY